MINSKITVVVLISAILIVGAYVIISSGVMGSGNSIKVIGTGSSVIENGKTIFMEEDGFSPKAIVISKGETVIFTNNDPDRKHWPASNNHPSHNLYPESGIEKCQTEEKNLIFDSCRGLEFGESWSFTFNEVGSWTFHDHFNPTFEGIITVED